MKLAIMTPPLIRPAALVLAAVLSWSSLSLCGSPSPTKGPGPLSPREEQKTLRVLPGFRVELVACEPEVIDPVAIAFDENGRLFVAEMRGYPNAGVATGQVTSGRVKMLEDRDGDGFYEHSTLFADGLRFPTAVMPWQGGLVVANAPDITFFEDTDGDGKADRHRDLYTGFELDNIQQLINSLQWGMDNWVHGCAGGKGGTVRSAEKPQAKAVVLRGRGVRFHPDVPASMEPTSGGGQFGLAPDEWSQWFTATNSQHLRHIVVPDHYLRRNPFLAVRAVTLDIPDHNAACKVHRISPFEAWRVERTTRRKGSPDARRFPSTELVPGGYITSACSPVVYCADRFPARFRGNTFVCDPANNLVHRDVLVPNGATFIAQRADADCEFLASTDNWFRPVNLTIGPDGALYVVDFYREVIETPLSLPDDIKQKLNLESRGRGRIWRVVPEESAANAKKYAARLRPALRKASTEALVRHLADGNQWWRLTAQRLLVERQDQTAVAALQNLARTASAPPSRAHALWTLEGLHALDDVSIANALRDSSAGVREQALRLADSRLAASADLRRAAVALADDPSPRVRFQLAFTLGQSDAPEAVAALARVARRDAGDKWTQTAVLSSAARTAPALLEALVRDKQFLQARTSGQTQFLTRLAALVGTQPGTADLSRALGLLAVKGQDSPASWQIAILEGLGQGLQSSQRSLARLWDNPPPALQGTLEQTRLFFDRAKQTALDDKRPFAERAAAIRLLGYGPFAMASAALPDLLAPRQPGEVQLAAVHALAAQDNAKVADVLLAQWGSYGPTLRREVLETMFARPERVRKLLGAMEQKQVLAGQLEPARLALLRKYPDARVRQQAQKLLAGQVAPARQKVVEDYRQALALKGETARGKAIFKKTCATCHRLENEGTEVGPDLLSALRTKTPETLLVDILDPSREVDPRYLEYQVTTTAGRVYTGLVAAETATSLTLRRAEKAEDTVLRNQIDTIQATAKSLMPDGLEMQLSRQDVADVIAYLLAVAAAG
jgi:putative membrane-bound dehydrogenase-like protein